MTKNVIRCTARFFISLNESGHDHKLYTELDDGFQATLGCTVEPSTCGC